MQSRGRARPRRRIRGHRLLLGAALVLFGLALHGQAVAAEGAPKVRVLQVDDMINPITERYISRGIEEARSAGAELLLVELDTPGGLLDSTQQITRSFLTSEVPIAVYVSPQGARAASAGVFVTMAAHVAAMAPNTRIGAATPVDSSGGDIGEDLRAKIINDTVVYARQIAAARDRNADWAEEAVRQAAVVGADEAVELDVVDLVALDRTDLLTAIDGRTVMTPSGEVTLSTANATVTEQPMSVFERLFMAIANPNIALLLLSLGGLAIYFELANPGAMIPGIVGVIFLLLAFLSLGTLPVSGAGIALILAGLALLGAELFVASGGVLGVGGVIAFGLGGLLLIDESQSPFLEVSRPLVIGLTVTLGAFVLVAMRGVVRARRRPVAVGGNMESAVARVRGANEVWIAGELWQAHLPDKQQLDLPPGTPVRVLRRDGLRLTVEPLSDSEAVGLTNGDRPAAGPTPGHAP